MNSSSRGPSHRWTFFRTGGLDQVSLQTGADLLNLKYLDQKLWVALSCPVKGLELDERTLALLDTDQNGRIRVPEILGAIDWMAARLKNIDAILRPADTGLPLELINEQAPEGKILLASIKEVMTSLGKPDAAAIQVTDTTDTAKIFANTRFNGDGIVTPDAAEDETTKQVINEIIATYGGETDRSGKPGVNQAKVDQFFADLASYVEWDTRGLSPEIKVAGEQTAAAYAAVKAVRAKIDDYFARCSLAAFDPRSLTALNRQESEYLVVATKDLTLSAGEMTGFPLARIEPGRPLPLTTGLNPAWAGAIATLRLTAVAPLFGPDKSSLSPEEWSILTHKLSAYEAWQASRSPSPIDKLGPQRIRTVVTSPARTTIAALIARDQALAPAVSAIGDVERLTRYYRDFATLLRSFVNFSDFYDPQRLATFQAGTLYLDSRSCELCIRLDDPAAHGVLASLSKCYIAYCDLKRVGSETMKIAACFTQGDSDYLMVGRNGLFYDRKGRDWDATITKVIDNPISIRQAFWLPYKKVVRLIEEQAAKRAAAAEAASDARLASAATGAVSADTKKPAEPRKIDVGVVAALGVAVGALTTAFGYFLGFFKGMPIWQIPLVFVAVILLISLPSMAIAWLKLRQRTAGPILDANGWAVNGRVKINLPFGTSLTERAKLPPGADHKLRDPFADKEAARRKFLIVLVLLLGVVAYSYYAYSTHHWPFEKSAPEPTPAPEIMEPKAG